MLRDEREQAAEFVERESTVAVGVGRAQHVLRLLVSERLAEVLHRLLDLLGGDVPVGVVVERAECFVQVGVVRVLTEVLHDAAELVEADAVARSEQLAQSVLVDGELQLLTRGSELKRTGECERR